MAISVVINTKNSVKTLEKAVRSASFADEVIVVDMQSTDGTPELAKQLGARIYYHSDLGFVEPARQFAIEKAKSDWVFVLDADEVIPQKLAQRLALISQEESEAVAYAIPRKNIIFKQWVESAGWWPDFQIRFFKRGSVSWPSSIHAVPEVVGTTIELSASEDLAIEHHNYSTVSEFIQRMDRYTTIQSSEKESGKQSFTGKSMTNAFKKEFLRRCFADTGYRSGAHGFALSFLQAFSELTVTLKQWEAAGFKTQAYSDTDLQALFQFRSELLYWLADAKVRQTTGLWKLWWQFRRKFQV